MDSTSSSGDGAVIVKNGDAPMTKGFFETRYIYTLMTFLGITIAFGDRTALSVAIVGMVDRSANNNNSVVTGTECGNYSGTEPEETHESNGEFTWDATEQGLILGGFSFGYLCTQLIGGFLAERYGGKWVLGPAVFSCSAMNFILPTMARKSIPALLTVRIIQGMLQGPSFPSMFSMAAKWLPTPERNRMMTFIMAGSQAGLIISLPLSGVMTNQLGWASPFYLIGSAGTLWFCLWVYLVYNSPDEHPRISKAELAYLKANVKSNRLRKLPPAPYLEIIKTKGFWAIQLSLLGSAWGNYTMMTSTPLYLNNVQHFSLSTNGGLSALPYVCMYLMSFPVSYTADRLVNSGKFRTITIRKLFTIMGLGGPALALVWLAFVECDRVQAVLALCLASGLNSGKYAGTQMNFYDMSPNYAGSILGISNTGGSAMGFISPIVTGALTDDKQTILSWRYVFLLAAILLALGTISFLIFGTATVQHYNDPDWREKRKREKLAAATVGQSMKEKQLKF